MKLGRASQRSLWNVRCTGATARLRSAMQPPFAGGQHSSAGELGQEAPLTATAGTPGSQISTAFGRSPFTGPCVRCFAIALLLTAFLTSGGEGFTVGMGTALGAGLVLITFDKRHPLSLRNFFVLYTVALFCVGVPLFRLKSSLYGDMVVFVLVFLSGYAVSSARRTQHSDARTTPVGRLPAVHSWDRVRLLEELMLVAAGLQVLLLAVNISKYGVGGFYNGQALVDQLSTYGKASVSGGLTQIVTFLVKYSTIALIIVYVHICIQAGIKIRYRYLLFLLVGMPILSLARSDALHGTGLIIVINATARRIGARADAARETSTEAGNADPPRFGPRPRLAPRRTFAITAMTVMAILAALVIGGLRQNALTPDVASSPLRQSVPLLQSEFTPIQAYSDIKDNSQLLKRQRGATIVLPLIFKVLPRGIFPGKPINSGAYFMSVVRPIEFAAGFAIPPTLFGDAYLNFGAGGAVLASLLVGLVAARLDVAYKEARLSRVPWFLIVYANFYALVRSPLSETLAGVLLTAGAWAILSHLLAGRNAGEAMPAATSSGRASRGRDTAPLASPARQE